VAVWKKGGVAEPVQLRGQRGDFAEDQQGRRAHVFGGRAFRQVIQRAEDHPLLATRAVLDQRERRACAAAVREQLCAQAVEPGHAHVHRQRLPFLRQRRPVEFIERLPAMRGDQAYRLRVIAMGQWNAGIRGAGQSGGDAGHDFEADAVRAQEFQFLAAAAEHEWIAALEPDHAFPGERVLQHELVDALLRGVVLRGLLADFDELGVAARQLQHVAADQSVMQDHIGLVEQAQCAQRQQARIARAGADKRHAAWLDGTWRGRESGIQCLCCFVLPSLSQECGNRAAQQVVEEAPALVQLRISGPDASARLRQQFRQLAQ